MTTAPLTRTLQTAPGDDLAATMAAIGHRARDAAAALALAPAETKIGALQAAAAAVRAQAKEILAANAEDIAAARGAGIGAALIDRLALDPKRVARCRIAGSGAPSSVRMRIRATSRRRRSARRGRTPLWLIFGSSSDPKRHCELA